MLLFMHGESLFGAVDPIPGLGHVATRFVHACGVPLIPLQTVIVTREEGTIFEGSYDGVRIALDRRSLVAAYAQGVCTALAVFGGVELALAFVLPGLPIWLGVACLALGLGLFVALARTFARPASYERAIELCDAMHLPKRARVAIDLAYERIDDVEAERRLRALEAEKQAAREELATKPRKKRRVPRSLNEVR